MMVRIVTVRQGQLPVAESIEPTLDAMRQIVGGPVECTATGLADIDIFCHEEAIAMKLPPNACGILGPFFFARCDGDGELVSLTDGDISRVQAFFKSCNPEAQHDRH